MIRPDYLAAHAQAPRSAPPRPRRSRSRDARGSWRPSRALIPAPRARGCAFALVGGEAGSGKSRLVREFAHEAGAAGALVLYGACDAVVQRAVPPVRGGARAARARSGPRGRCAPTSARAAASSRGSLPDLAHRVGGLPAPVAADPDTERHRLHSAVADLLTAVEQAHPRSCWSSRTRTGPIRRRCCCCGTSPAARRTRARCSCSPPSATPRRTIPEALSAALADLRRSEGVVRLRLAGLSAEEIAEFVRRAGGGDPRAELPRPRRALRELTGGNAFLMTELWRDARRAPRSRTAATAAAGRGRSPSSAAPRASARSSASASRALAPRPSTCSSSPPSPVRSSTSPSCARGRPGEPALLAALDEAVAHGMIEEVPARQLAYRFTHELVRRALYDRMPGLRRPSCTCASPRRSSASAGDRPASPSSPTTSPPPCR